MNEIYPIAQLGNSALIVNSEDLAYVGKERAMEVKCVKVDFEYGRIDPIIELERHLKFNPWEETEDYERNDIISNIGEKFSEAEIMEKIIEPLAANLIEPKMQSDKKTIKN